MANNHAATGSTLRRGEFCELAKKKIKKITQLAKMGFASNYNSDRFYFFSIRGTAAVCFTRAVLYTPKFWNIYPFRVNRLW